MELITKHDDRFYISSGKAYPRVTWILSYYPKGEGFARWLGSQESFEAAQEVMHKAGDRGTHVHTGIEKLIAGEELIYGDYTDEEWGMLEAFVRWVEEYKPVFELSEQRIISKKHGYTGTFDCIARINGVPMILDWKTSSAIYPSYWCQLAAYVQGAFECKFFTKDEEPQIGILRLGTKHKAGYEFKVEEDWKKHFDMFLAVKKIFHHENPKLEPSVKTFKPLLSIFPLEDLLV